MAELHIVFPLFPGVTHLDFTGPHQVFSRLPGAKVTAASMGGRDIAADGLVFTGLADLSATAGCDMICVPGGLGTTDAMLDDAFVSEVRRLASDARYVTSVCTGSLILAAAGFVRGKRTACHWAWRELLAPFGAIIDEGRVVRDGDLITGGGVTAGLDFALTVVAELAGPEAAQGIQLGLEYAPEPPFSAGRPETAPAEVVARYNHLMAGLMTSRRSAADEAAARLATPA
jgi:putative intracellular protease/amidase